MKPKNYYSCQVGGHKIDYFYDGESMMVFGTERLEAVGVKITGRLTKLLRQNAETQNG